MHEQLQQGRGDACTARMPIKRHYRKAHHPAMLQVKLVRLVCRPQARPPGVTAHSLCKGGRHAHGPALDPGNGHPTMRSYIPVEAFRAAARQGCPARARSGVEAHGLGGRRVCRARASARGRQRHAARQAAARVRREDEQRARRGAGHDALLRADRKRGQRAAAALVAHYALRAARRGRRAGPAAGAARRPCRPRRARP